MAAADGARPRACPDAWSRLSRDEQRRHAQRIGNDPVRHHGKRRYDTVHAVHEADRRRKVDIALVCWSNTFFNSHPDFGHHHLELGEACDDTAMKVGMPASVSADSAAS